jgi:hypothetical protein
MALKAQANLADWEVMQGLEAYLLRQATSGQNVLDLAANGHLEQTLRAHETKLRWSVGLHTYKLRLRQAWLRLVGGVWLERPQNLVMPGAYALALGLVLFIGFNWGISSRAIIDAHQGNLPTGQILGTEMGGNPTQPLPPAQMGSAVKTHYAKGEFRAATLLYARGGNFTAEDHLLAGCAYLHLGQPKEAVATLNYSVEQGSPDGISLQDQRNYYLVFAYLAADHPDQAAELLEQIRENKDFSFRKEEIKANSLYAKVKILSWVQ